MDINPGDRKRTEDGGRGTGNRRWKTEGERRRTEDGGKETEDGGRKTGSVGGIGES